jgi:hypothetical protein
MRIEFALDEAVAEHFGDDVATDAPRGVWVPMLVCEHCSETVKSGYDASLLFRTDPGPERGVVRVVHDECVEAFQEERTGRWLREGLNVFPVQLANALHPDPLVVYDLTQRPWSPEPELIGIPAPAGGSGRSEPGSSG